MNMVDKSLSDRLIGAWQLKDWRIEYPDGRTTRPFGSDAGGVLLYCADGWMSAAMWRRERTTLAADGSGADQRILCEYLGYGGRWHVQGSRILHEVTHSVNPVLIGTTQARTARFAHENLILEAAEQDGERRRLHTIEWARPAR